MIFFRQLHTQEYKATKKQIVRFQLKLDHSTSFCCKIVLGMRLASAIWKEVYGKPDNSNELTLKTKVGQNDRPDNI